MGNSPNPEQILQQFSPVIQAVVAVAHGNQPARSQVETLFDALTQNGWQVAVPVQRIWAGERDETCLIAGIDPTNALIIRVMLKELQGSHR